MYASGQFTCCSRIVASAKTWQVFVSLPIFVDVCLVIGSYILIHVIEDREISPALLERISRYDHDKVHRRLLQKRLNGTGQWFLARPEFQAWRTRAGHPCLWCSGKGMQWLTDINRRILMCSCVNSWLGKNNDRVGN